MSGEISRSNSSVPQNQGVQTADQDRVNSTDTAVADKAAPAPPATPGQKAPQDPKAEAKSAQAARDHAADRKMQTGVHSIVVQRNLQSQVPKQPAPDATGLKPGEQISAQITDNTDILRPIAERTFDFSRPVTREQAAAIIFQNGKLPAGTKLVQGEGNKWILQYHNTPDGRHDVGSHYNARQETVRTREKAPHEMFYPDPEVKMTWTGGKLNTTSTGPKRRDLSGEYGFTIAKRYSLDEGLSPHMNVRRMVQPGPGYEMAFEKPMTKDQVMQKLFQKDKLQNDQVRLIPVPHEPTKVWQVQLLDSQAPLTKEAGNAIGDSNTYGKESAAPGIPTGIRAHIENQTVPANAKKFEPDVFVWEQEGHIVRVQTNGEKGTNGYYKYEETKLSNDKASDDTMRWLMLEKGMPVREAWQAYIEHWDEIDIGMMGMVDSASSMRVPHLGGGPTPKAHISEPQIRSRMRAGEPPVPHESIAKGSTTAQEHGAAKNTTTANEPTAKPVPKRTTAREDEEAAAARTTTVSHHDEPDAAAKGEKKGASKTNEATATSKKGAAMTDSQRMSQLSEWERQRKVTGDVDGLKRRLRDGDPYARADFEKIQKEISEGKKPHIEKYGEDHRVGPAKTDKISSSFKVELEKSTWLKERLPSEADRSRYMEWLERQHTNEIHDHVIPHTAAGEQSLIDFSLETGKKIHYPEKYQGPKSPYQGKAR